MTPQGMHPWTTREGSYSDRQSHSLLDVPCLPRLWARDIGHADFESLILCVISIGVVKHMFQTSGNRLSDMLGHPNILQLFLASPKTNIQGY